MRFTVPEDSICNFSSICPPFPFPFCCHRFPLNLRASHLSSCVLSPPLSLVFCILPCSAVSSLFFWLFFPSDSPLLPPHHSIFTCHSLTLLYPPTFFLSWSPSIFYPVGRRRNLGDQWREHQGHEARASHRAHQEWRPARPSGAQEG